MERGRLFDRLDALAGKKVVWIFAPAGSGKTTLVASWLDSRKTPCLWYQADEDDSDLATFFSCLGMAAKYAAPRYRTPLPLLTREYRSGVSTFTKRYFETLFGRLKPPSCFVIDNYQDVPLTSQFHEAVRDGLSMVPGGMSVVVISRFLPPPIMSRFQMNGQLEVISQGEIDFTLEESRALITTRAKEKPSDDLLDMLYRKTEGWVAGLVLLTESGETTSGAQQPLVKRDLNQVFNYFAGEVFAKLDSETRDFLLMTAFLPKMTVDMAEKMTGLEDAGRILQSLNHNNLFTQMHKSGNAIYQYHQLFRTYLLTRMKASLSPEGIHNVQYRAAGLLEESGLSEDAARLLSEACEWQGLTELVLRHAAGHMAAGRFRTIKAWIDAIPTELVGRTAWLQYWKASCSITTEPAGSRRIFENAYSLFLAARQAEGAFLSWSGIVNAYLYEWRDFHPLDRWIEEFEELQRRFEGFPSREIEERATAAIFAAMMFRQPQHPDLPRWAERVQAIMQNTPDISHRMFIGYNLVLYYLWTGRITEAGTLVSMLAPVVRTAQGAPLPKLMWYRSLSLYYFYVAQPEKGIETIEQGLHVAEETGVHIIDLALVGVALYNATPLGDAALAKAYLDQMAALLDKNSCYANIFYASQAPLVAFLQGNFETALAQARESVRITAAAGCPLIHNSHQAQLLYILSGMGKFDQISPHLAELRARAVQTRSEHVEAWCLSCEAQQALHEGNETLFAERFSRMVQICNKTGLRLVGLFPTILERLCVKALELDIETDFVKEQIRLNKLVPDSSTVVVDSWPYPIKIRTLGKFELIVEDKPLIFKGKVQQKPLAMLKAIIALGGRDVDNKMLTDSLWPEAEGDIGSRSFYTTLHRLRKLLPDDRVIQLQEGKVSLDERYCWVDTWAFEGLLGTVEKNWTELLKTGHMPETWQETLRFLEKAISMYRGHFLPGEEAEPWVLSLRERLRSKYMGAVSRLGSYRMEMGELEKSVEVFQRALEIDDLSEGFYQNLMVSYVKLGRKAEAAGTYNRCKTILWNKLGLTPSQKTDEIYHMVKS